jgi:tRNA1(Val) A37 N6-methylase TrmN6
MSREQSADVSDDAVLNGRLRLLQPRRGHRFGHDAILLAAATEARTGQRAVDLGAGVGTAGLALAVRIPGLAVTLIELDPTIAALAADNAKRNDLADRVTVAALDVSAQASTFRASGLPPGAADVVLMNPPFHDARQSAASPDPSRRSAHVADDDTLEIWMKTVQRLLRPDGALTLIYRADGLTEVLRALARGFGSIGVLPVYGRPNTPAIRVIVRGVKGSRAPLTLWPGLVLNDADGQPTAAAEAILRSGTALTFDH